MLFHRCPHDRLLRTREDRVSAFRLKNDAHLSFEINPRCLGRPNGYLCLRQVSAEVGYYIGIRPRIVIRTHARSTHKSGSVRCCARSQFDRRIFSNTGTVIRHLPRLSSFSSQSPDSLKLSGRFVTGYLPTPGRHHQSRKHPNLVLRSESRPFGAIRQSPMPRCCRET